MCLLLKAMFTGFEKDDNSTCNDLKHEKELSSYPLDTVLFLLTCVFHIHVCMMYQLRVVSHLE